MANSTYSRPKESYDDWAGDYGKPARLEKELYQNAPRSGFNRPNFSRYVLELPEQRVFEKKNQNTHTTILACCIASVGESLRGDIRKKVDALIAQVTKAQFLAGVHNRAHVAGWLQKAISIDQAGEIDQALDVLYRNIDRLMRIGEFSAVNNAMKSIDVGSTSVDILLGLLTATLPAQSKLSARSVLRREVEKTLRDRGEYEDSLLTGL